MAVVILDGRVRVTWCTAISNINSPTTTELNAGTALETLIRPDGLKINPSTAKVDSSNLGSKYTTNRAGRVDYAVSLTIHHDGTTDTAWSLFPYRTSGFLVVRRGIDRTTAWTTGQGAGAATGTIAILPLESGMPDESDPAPNTNWDFEVEFFLTADPADRAVVA